MRIGAVVLIGLVLALTATAVMAQNPANNTWIGMTGLVIAPSADTLGERELTASYNWIDTDNNSTDILSGIIGLTPDFELGIANIGNGDSETIGNLKYRLDLSELTGNPTTADLAIGVWDLGDDVDQALYIALSDDFARGQIANARWTLGLANSDGDILDGLFAGVELPATEQGRLQVDYDGENVNAAYRHMVSEQVTVGIGLIDSDLGLNFAYTTEF